MLQARNRAHVLVGLAIAVANIDEVIRVIRASKTQIEAKERLIAIKTPAAMLERMQIVAAPDMGVAHEDLRKRAPAGTLHHFVLLVVIEGSVDLGHRRALTLQQ